MERTRKKGYLMIQLLIEVLKVFKYKNEKWGKILKIIVDIIMFFSRSNHALIGHLEKIPDSKKTFKIA